MVGCSELDSHRLHPWLGGQVRCRAEMEDETEPLLQRADMLWRQGGLRDTDRLFGHARDTLEQVRQCASLERSTAMRKS